MTKNADPIIFELPPDCSSLKLTKSQREWLGKLIFLDLKTVEEIYATHKISKSSLRRYAKYVKEGRIFHERAGRPPILNEKGKNRLRELIVETGFDVHHIYMKKFMALLNIARRYQYDE